MRSVNLLLIYIEKVILPINLYIERERTYLGRFAFVGGRRNG